MARARRQICVKPTRPEPGPQGLRDLSEIDIRARRTKTLNDAVRILLLEQPFGKDPPDGSRFGFV